LNIELFLFAKPNELLEVMRYFVKFFGIDTIYCVFSIDKRILDVIYFNSLEDDTQTQKFSGKIQKQFKTRIS